ncbi:MAG TPA: thioredoxin-dependent thiol peroxidase [Bacteroidales bacterium]|jgi:peroxiredoxin Q/BCP|nr:MAG: putative peroxiredoxin bcp [Bacteroidetes bacterium ADurb.Bin416]HBL73192.1 thioredoxin-dependent thiol peroxidase [Bacteroidales bacterium]
MLQPGDKAPAFQGFNQHNQPISLSDYAGKRVILYFYPKDNTPGCTAEACSLNDNLAHFTSKGFIVIGVSPDSVDSHQRFATKFNLGFNLIADTDKAITQAYGAWGEKKNYGKTYMGLLRTTFVIDAQGMIEAVVTKVDTKGHAEQLWKILGV